MVGICNGVFSSSSLHEVNDTKAKRATASIVPNLEMIDLSYFIYSIH